jgi:CheY-like chemotaxis protein
MKTRRILIVDDAPEFANMVKDALSTMEIPLQVTIYLSAEEAWLEVLKTRFDLVVTDLRLPGISGTELVRRIRQRFPKIKIIAVSGLAEAGLNERTRAAGVDAFYRKPVEMPLLLTKIDNLLADLNQEEGTAAPAADERPQKPQLLSRLTTAPLGYTPPPASEEAKEAAAKAAPVPPSPTAPTTILPPDPAKNQKQAPKHSPEDVASMRDLEQRLLKLMRDSGAQSVVLTTQTGQVLYGSGVSPDFHFPPELVSACSSLVTSLKEVARTPEETTTLGVLVLAGNNRDSVVVNVSKFLVWLLFSTGSQPSEISKATSAVYSSKDSLQFILNMLALLPVPTHPHPPVEGEQAKIERMATMNTDELKIAEKINQKSVDKKDADDFWNPEVQAKPEGTGETIDFEKAASMGLIPSEHPKK